MTDIIKLDSVTKIYKNFTAVNGVNLQIREGEILGLIGHNGAGKTTTLKMIVGLLAPTEGKIEVMGQDITKENTKIKQHIGYLPEESPLPWCRIIGPPRCGSSSVSTVGVKQPPSANSRPGFRRRVKR